MNKPNFIFIITDQQRYDHVGYMGNKQLKTPNIDKLANTGSWFSKFYVSSPTCMSNRATFMTGRMPSVNGVRYNGLPLDLDSVTFVDLLKDAGYSTALIGKCHLQGMVEVDSMVPKPTYSDNLTKPSDEHSEAMRSHFTVDDYQCEMQGAWRRDKDYGNKLSNPYYGFEDVQFCLGHGDTATGHYSAWQKNKLSGKTVGGGIEHALEVSQVNAPQVYKPAMTEDVYPTTYVKEQSIEWLKAHAKDKNKQPFFLQIAFPDPHHPFTPPGKYWSMYDPESVDLPLSFYNPNKNAIPPVKFLWDEYEKGKKPPRWVFPFVASEPEAKDILAKTYGQITMIDDAVGHIMSTLESTGLLNNTVVCFMSDHGDYLGDHGLMLKGPMNYESIIRVPFIWKDPDSDFNTGRIDLLGTTLDLAQTVLQRAGIKPYNGIQGMNLLPVLNGSIVNQNREILVETTDILIEAATKYSYLGFDKVVTVHTLVDSCWKLSVWQGCEWGELYDLKNDPYELVNLWYKDEMQAVRAKLMLRLVHQIQNHADCSPHPLSIS